MEEAVEKAAEIYMKIVNSKITKSNDGSHGELFYLTQICFLLTRLSRNDIIYRVTQDKHPSAALT